MGMSEYNQVIKEGYEEKKKRTEGYTESCRLMRGTWKTVSEYILELRIEIDCILRKR